MGFLAAFESIRGKIDTILDEVMASRDDDDIGGGSGDGGASARPPPTILLTGNTPYQHTLSTPLTTTNHHTYSF